MSKVCLTKVILISRYKIEVHFNVHSRFPLHQFGVCSWAPLANLMRTLTGHPKQTWGSVLVLLSVMLGLVGIVTKNANTIGLNHEFHPLHHVYLKCEFGSVVKQNSKEDFLLCWGHIFYIGLWWIMKYTLKFKSYTNKSVIKIIK